MNGISVIIPTYKNILYLEKCVKSIENSFKELNYNDYEILIGIDGCTETVNYVKTNNYLNKFSIFYFYDNKGPYLIKNSLSEITKYDMLLFFDSDDLMRKEMISEIIKYHKTYKVIRFGFKNFTDEGKINKSIMSIQIADGVISIDKEIFKSINGYYPWMCGADTEIINRISNKKINVYRSSVYSFDRRIHDTNLTRKKETNFSSPIRKDVANQISILKQKGYPSPNILHKEKFLKIIFEKN